jgi:hypothetical protein
MTNLSDLFPAGAGKQVSFTASGNVTSSGKPVVLNSDGTVSEVSGSAQSIGTEATFMTGSTYGVRIVYDDNANKVVVAYRDSGNSNHGYAAVGTVSGTSISWGTPVVFESNNISGDLWASYDSAENKVVIAYSANVGSAQGEAIVGDVSGTSISFGTGVIFSTNAASQFGCAYDVANAKTVIAYRDGSTDGMAVVATVSSTSISYGTPVQYNNGNSIYNDVIYDSNAEKVVISFRDASASDNGKAVVGTVSGTSISYGAVATFASATTDYTSSAFDSTNNKAVIIYVDQSDSNKGKGVVGTVSGTSISFGDAATWTTTNSPGTAATFDPDTGQVIVVGTANQGAGQFARGTVSGTSISFSELFTFTSGNTDYPTATYDTGSDRAVFAYQDAGNSLIGTGIVVQVGSTNLTASAFLGISDAAISSAASGNITIKGGIAATGLSSLTPASDYYVQDDGTITTVSSSVKAGKALSATAINLEYQS